MTQNIHELVKSLLAPEMIAFTPGRYPNTYAYDFYRMHQDDFPDPPEFPVPRAVASRFIQQYAERTGQDLQAVLIALADGYLVEANVTASLQQRLDALADKLG